MSYSRRIILMKGIGGLKSRKRTPTSTNIVFDNSLPQRLLTKKRKRIYKIVRQTSNGNKLSSIVFFIFLLLLLLKIMHSCDLRETLADNETQHGRAQSYLAHVYGYAGKPLKSFHDQLVSQLAEQTKCDKQVEGILNSGGPGINNGFTSAKLFKCLSTRVESHPKTVKPIGNEIVSCIVSAPSDAGVTCTSKLLCCLSGARPKNPCILRKVNYIDPARDFNETRKNKNCWQQYLIGSPSTCVPSVCKMMRLEFMSLSIIHPTPGMCVQSLPDSGSATGMSIVCNSEEGKKTNDVQRLFHFVAGTDMM